MSDIGFEMQKWVVVLVLNRPEAIFIGEKPLIVVHSW
jgi:hypothetical protein